MSMKSKRLRMSRAWERCRRSSSESSVEKMEKIGCANSLAYGFKDNKLYIVMVLSSPSDEDEILDYLKERYIFSPKEVQAYTWGGVDGLDDAHITTFVAVKLDADFKYDYMLQTYFMSKNLTKSSAKSKFIKAQTSKLIRSMY